jgi:ABC-type polysaccharide/polyol phosphate export permease
MTAAVGEGCGAFVIAHSYLKQLPLPQGVFIFRTLLTQVIYLGVGVATAVAVGLISSALPYEGLAKALPGLLLLVAYAYGAIGTMAYLGVRYRDLAHGFAGLFSLLFVVSPVIYPAEMLIKRGLPIAVYGNPFASLLEVVRGPLLSGRFADGLHYAVAGVFAGMLILARIYLARSWTSQVPMWL